MSGELVSVAEFLDKVREVVAHYALSTVLSEHELGKVDSSTAFYVLWKWTIEPLIQTTNDSKVKETSASKKIQNGSKAVMSCDDALKLAHSVGVEIDTLLKARLIKQVKENIRMLGPMDRKSLHLLGQTCREGNQPPVIDMIHRAVILWSSQESAELDNYLEASGANGNEVFWRVAQALSNLLPFKSGEKQLLDGLLSRHPSSSSRVGKKREDKRIDDYGKKGGKNE